MQPDPISPGFEKQDNLKIWLKKQIAEGKFPARSRLPSVRKLAKRFHISPKTANMALRDLEKEGSIAILPRKGAFVVEGSEPEPLLPGPELDPPKTRAEELADELAAQISHGDLKAGDLLPIRKVLKFRFRTSYSTVNHGLKIAEQKGLIHRSGPQLIVGPPRISSPGNRKKVYALPAWSIAESKQFRQSESRPDFLFEFEKELSHCGVTYRGNYGPDMYKRSGPAIQNKPDAAGYYYSCSPDKIEIASDNDQSLMEKEIKRLDQLDVPTVIFNCVILQEIFPRLSFRSFKNVYAIGQEKTRSGEVSGTYLASLGHRNVAFIAFTGEPWDADRLVGLEQGIAESVSDAFRVDPFLANFQATQYYSPQKLHSQETLDAVSDFTTRVFRGYKLKHDTFARGVTVAALGKIVQDQYHIGLQPYFEKALTYKDITAWVCSDSVVGLAAAEFLGNRRIRVPEQISLLAIDDNHTLSNHAISGCDLQIPRMGYLAAHCILGDIPVRKGRKGVVECLPRIVDRGSVARV